jgi:WD40 repeat protein
MRNQNYWQSLRCCCRFACLALLLLSTLVLGATEDAGAQAPQKIDIVPQIAHSSVITSVAVSEDALRIVSGGHDNTAKIWEVATGILLRTLHGHSGPVYAVAFSPDGTHIITASHDKTMKLWTTSTGKLVRTFQHSGLYDVVFSAGFSRNGDNVLSGTLDGTLRVWDVSTGKLIRTVKAHSKSLTSIALSDSGRILTGSTDRTVKLWDGANGGLIRTFVGHTDEVNSVSISRDGSRIVAGSDDQTLRIWDSRSGSLLLTLAGKGGPAPPSGISEAKWRRVKSVAISPDGSHVASGSFDGMIRLWDVSTGREQAVHQSESSGHALVFSTEGRHLFSAGVVGKVFMLEARTLSSVRTFGGLVNLHAWASFLPGGLQVLSTAGGKAMVWDASTGQMVRAFDAQAGSFAVSRDGKTFVASSEADTAKQWDIDTGRIVTTFEGHATGEAHRGFSAVALTADGRHRQ